MFNKVLIIALAVFTLLQAMTVCVMAQDTTISDKLNGYDDYVQQAMVDWNVPGLAIAIIKDGELVYKKGFGYRNLEEKLEVTPETLFPIGSTTKAFTATSIGILVDENKINWDDPVRKHIPWFAMDNDYSTDHLTIRDALAHRSGLARHDAILSNFQGKRKDLLEKVRYLPTSKELRSNFIYNNHMYILGGYIIEPLTGNTWEEFVKDRIFSPLGMNSSNFTVEELQKSGNYSLPYAVKDNKPVKANYDDIKVSGPAGSINSNIIDMSNWVKFNLGKGKFNNKQIISEASITELYSPQMVTCIRKGLSLDHPCTYGMGWVNMPYKGETVIWHNGEIEGFHANVSLVPDKNLGVVILSNGQTTLPEALAITAIDRILDLPSEDWSNKLLAENTKDEQEIKDLIGQVEKMRIAGTKPSHAINHYAGTYNHKGYGDISFEVNGKQLILKYHDVIGPVKHFHYDTFEGEGDLKGLLVMFETDQTGTVTKVQVPFDPSVSPIVFEKK